MPTLSVTDFSCLRTAEFHLAPVNVIIGPQGSGKSVTTKLFYFFAEILTNFQKFSERGDSVEDYKTYLSKQFNLWFPPPAWGPRRFNINYSAGEFSVRVLRRMRGGRMDDDVAITFSDWFNKSYDSARDLFERTSADEAQGLETNVQVRASLDRIWRVREVISSRIAKEIGEHYIEQQTFIPAGRAFFTSIGRLVAGFEQAGSLDPVTIRFARLFASLRDRKIRRFPRRTQRVDAALEEKRLSLMTTLFGGQIKFEEDHEFIETKDGRKIPFACLSSGQQDLLPMWSLMDYFDDIDAQNSVAQGEAARASPALVYIEEPEAHLFPSAQSLLMEYLIGGIVSIKNSRSLIITTHSPYIMSKLNVFLKAGQLSRRRRNAQEISEVVPRDCWLTLDQLSAVAMEDGNIRGLIDQEGLIDGACLDDVSETISREFFRLLQIESEM